MYIPLFKLTYSIIIVIHNLFCHIHNFAMHLWHLNIIYSTKWSNVMQKWSTLFCNYSYQKWIYILHLDYEIKIIYGQKNGQELILWFLIIKTQETKVKQLPYQTCDTTLERFFQGLQFFLYKLFNWNFYVEVMISKKCAIHNFAR